VSSAAASHIPTGRSDDADAVAARPARRQAVAELGEALRTLIQQATATEAATEDLLRAAAQIRETTAPLAEHQRTREQLPSTDDLLQGIRTYNPVCGIGSALAPPLRIELVDGVSIGTCTLGLAYEGPPMYVHGGVSALLMDQMLGHATTSSGHPGMTVNLSTQYRSPVPLQTPLHLTAAVIGVDGRKVTTRGTIATAAEPDRVLVEATGIFVALGQEQAQKLFGAMLNPDAANPALAHD
jgi:hypothetical protein